MIQIFPLQCGTESLLVRLQWLRPVSQRGNRGTLEAQGRDIALEWERTQTTALFLSCFVFCYDGTGEHEGGYAIASLAA
jgi:hypothetical protein